MFDFEYKPTVGFVPITSRVDCGNASEEEIEELSNTVAEQAETVAENSAAISNNAEAIAANADAISDETEARESDVEELNGKIDSIQSFKMAVVDALPATGDAGTIYLVKDAGKDTYSEFVYANGAWEKLGSDVDLTDYAKIDDIETAIEPLATKDAVDSALALKADTASVYTKDEADNKFLTEHQDISGLATKSEVEAGFEKVYTKSEADAKFLTEHQDITGLATKDELATAMDTVYTKSEADAKFLAEHQDISNKVDWVESTPGRKHIVLPNHDSILGTATDAQTYNLAMVSKWDVADFGSSSLHANINSKDEVVTINDSKQIATTDQIPEVSGFATKAQLEDETAAREQAIAGLHEEIVALPKFKILIVTTLPSVGDEATLYLVKTGDDAGNEYTEYVYVNGEWEEIGTQELDLSDYAKAADLETVSGVVENLSYEFESVDEKLAGLAAVNAEQNVIINEINSGLTELDVLKADKAELESLIAAKEAEIYNLTKIVGDLGGAVTYELPGENGKSFNTLMGNNGTVKLADDVTTGRFGPGITAKNAVKLNLNGHDLIVTGLTTSTAQGAIMARGTQEITIGGKGTIDAGEGICIEGNGASSIINLTGSTTVYRTDRSGGELVYCYAGTINITNGTFRNDGDDKKYMLNCYDANYANGTAKIVVTGGKFYDFNPADNSAEGEHTSFVPAGYEAVASTVVEEGVEHTVYTVKKSA